MRARLPAIEMSRLSLLPVFTIVVAVLTSCGGDGSTFDIDKDPSAELLAVETETEVEVEVEVEVEDKDNNTDTAHFTDYIAGAIAGYPLVQAPATGDSSLTWLIAETNGRRTPAELLERLQATNDAFSRYALEQSRGAFDLQDIGISPPLQIDTTGSKLSSITELQELIQAAADAEGYPYNSAYIAYLVIGDDFEGVTESTTGEQSGTMTVSADFEMSQTVQEMFHMLSVGTADAIEGGDATFPGQVIANGDPYFLTGNEASVRDCIGEADPCEFVATLSIPHKGRAGWLDTSEVVLSDNTGEDKLFRLFNHDNFERTQTKPLTVYLTGYDPNGLFAVSYLTNTPNNRVTSNGVMVHYVPYDAPADSYLLDLTPDSITTNEERPDDPAYTSLHDFGDAAVTQGTIVDIAGLFALEVLATGELASTENDTADHWADIKIKPSSCIYGPREFAKEDFLDQQVPATEGYCETSYRYDWGVEAASNDEVTKVDVSLQYRDLDPIGGSLKLAVSEDEAESLALNRPLSATYGNGDTLWISYLMAPRQISDGHMLVYPNSVVDAGIGKRQGDQFAIGNEAAPAPAYPVTDEVTWLVARYELFEGPDTITLWLNPETGAIPQPATAYMVRNDIDVGDINRISINLDHTGSGAYDIDRVYTGGQFTDISNVVASATPPPLIALHYDVSPDLDDLQAIAAGANLSEKFGISPAVVIGTYGSGQFAHGGNDPQSLTDLYFTDTNMLGQGPNNGETRRQKGNQVASAAYGAEGYLDTGDGWEATVNAQATKFWNSLQSGQSVLVADGGPMDFTADVLTRLQSYHGATDAELKLVTVVQHSLGFNVINTLPANMQKISSMATYVTIDNGNVGGNNTANLEDSSSNTTTSDFAVWARNNNSHTDAWNSALDDFSAKIDFSDTVEYLYILDLPLDQVSDIQTFRQLFE